jgi:hypothetical protein
VPTYLDIGVVRIQQYLGRTPQLRGRRGASALLSHEDLWAAVEPAVAPSARLNSEAGEVDGVVSLEVADGVGPDVVAGDVFARLRTRLPAAELQAVWGTGDEYVSVYSETIKVCRQVGDVLVDLPPVAEVPALLLCRACRLDPAVDRVHVPKDNAPNASEQLDVCADCAIRYRTHRRAGPQKTLLAWLKGTSAFPATLADLARTAGAAETQVATIAADGNRLGAVVEELAAHGVAKRDLVRRVDSVTKDALQLAVYALCDDPAVGDIYNKENTVAIELHVLGGDDVLVTVPASVSWLFVRTFLGEFAAAGDEAVRDLLASHRSRPSAPPRLTASAGMVFSHASEPVADTIRTAERLLRSAKQAVRGAEASVLWLDVTEEGRQIPDGRRPLLLADLADTKSGRLASALGDLAALPASRRAALARVAHDPERSMTEAVRTGVAAAVERFTSQELGLSLADALVVARWFR